MGWRSNRRRRGSTRRVGRTVARGFILPGIGCSSLDSQKYIPSTESLSRECEILPKAKQVSTNSSPNAINKPPTLWPPSPTISNVSSLRFCVESFLKVPAK